MKQIKSLLFVFLIFYLTDSVNAQKGFMKIGDIKGESTDDKHRDWISLLSFSQGLESKTRSAAGRMGMSKPEFQDLVITKSLDRSSPLLMSMAVSGEVIPEVILELTGADRNSYYIIKMENAMITSITSGGECTPDCRAMEEVSFNYTRITWEYHEGKAATGIKTGWDLKMNKKI